MCGKSMEMMKVYGKMPSEVMLETNWGMSMKTQLTIKYLSFREIPCIGQIFLV